MADKGEFSRRAFLNGKMDLIKAQGINDLINAKSILQSELAIKQLDGQTSKLINNLKEKLLYLIATCETNIDYPEYDDVEKLSNDVLLPKLKNIKKDILDIVEASKNSRIIYNGINVAIIGQPNAGKSSLLNSLINKEKAIVTSVPGTTRDIVEHNIQLGDILLNLKDTAGIRSTSNQIEKVGVNKTKEAIIDSDLILHIIDSKKGFNKKDEEIFRQVPKNKVYLKVFNKSDLKKTNNQINVSAKNKQINSLIEAINKTYSFLKINNDKIIYNTRQLSLILSSLNSIEEGIKGIMDGMGSDVVIVDIQKAWNDLANITGKADQEDLLDSIFKNFCLGK